MKQETLLKLQQTETEILLVIHDFCMDNNIKYSLYAGTGIGAVRHGGFIPWDDDMDICMERNEYNKFVELWEQNPVEGYTLQNPLKTKGLNIDHTKVFKNGTLLISDEEDAKVGNCGIWVDIFSLDKVPNNDKDYKYLIRNAYLREFFNRGNIIYKSDSIKKKIFKHVMRIIPSSLRAKGVETTTKHLQKFKDYSGDYYFIDFARIHTFNQHFPKKLTEEYILVDFNEYKFMIFKDYDTMLKIEYGDYMTLPPVEQRVCPHNPIKIKF